MTPLMDVIFLLLTFFVFSLTLLVRAQVLGVSLPSLTAAEDAKPSPTITVALDAAGACTVDGEPVALDGLVEVLRQRRAAQPGARLLIAADVGSRSGELLKLVDTLSAAGMRDFALVGRPSAAAPTGAINENENAPREGGRRRGL